MSLQFQALGTGRHDGLGRVRLRPPVSERPKDTTMAKPERSSRPQQQQQTQLQTPRYLALCARPMEPLVAAELAALPEVSDIEIGEGVVAFSGPRAALYRANLHLRCATRVLQQLTDFACDGGDDLYAAARDLPWEEFVRANGTLAVSAHGLGPGIDNSMFAALRVKDAACDRFRDRYGVRPDVDVNSPQLRINVQLYQVETGRGTTEARCSLSLDTSDPPLYQRGYRQSAGAAPLKETLAAALVAHTGYPQLHNKAADVAEHAPPGQDSLEPAPAASPPALVAPARPSAAGAPMFPSVVDLCCGSGTLLIEAGLQALNIAPGIARRFGFMTWRDFDPSLWQRLRREAESQRRSTSGPFLYGSDIDSRVLTLARKNLEAAGLATHFRLQRTDLRDAAPPSGPPGIVLCNPPYGERMGAETDLVALYRTLGDTLKRRFAGYTAYVYTANMALSRQIGLRSSARHILYNGNLEGRLLRFDLY